MEELNAVEAAKWLGISREAVDQAAREGRLPVLAGEGPRRFSREALEAYHQARVADRVAALARSRETPVSAARRIRQALDEKGTGLPRSFEARLRAMPEAWRQAFNRAELAAAGVRDGCRWCEAAKFSAVLGLRPVEYSEACAELFGGPPCGVCGPGLIRPYMAALATRVHPPGTRPPAPAPRASAAEREAAREWAARQRQEPVTAAAARPAGDDNGRHLVARRLREVRAQLKNAKRAGDQRHALHLAAIVRDLEADAARVDGRSVVTASARPGTLRCGHALAAGCGCPRIASKRSAR